MLFRFTPRCSPWIPRKKGRNWLKSLKPEKSLDKNPFPTAAGLARRRKKNKPASGTAKPNSRVEARRKLNFLLSNAVEYRMFASSSFMVCRYISLRPSNKRFRSSSSFTLRILTIHDLSSLPRCYPKMVATNSLSMPSG